jgi:hypothetical protein
MSQISMRLIGVFISFSIRGGSGLIFLGSGRAQVSHFGLGLLGGLEKYTK